MKLAAPCLMALAVLATANACVDTSPIDYVAPVVDAGESLTDAAIYGEGGLKEQCRDCIATTCASEFDACNADPRCSIIGECLIEEYCFNFDISNLANLKPCLLACAVKAQILSSEDPATALFAPLVRCGQFPTQCGAVCNVK